MQCIRELREKLGDQEHQLIETLHNTVPAKALQFAATDVPTRVSILALTSLALAIREATQTTVTVGPPDPLDQFDLHIG